jgi:hypothetical protein
MRRRPSVACLLLVSLLAALASSACIRRAPVNDSCTWDEERSDEPLNVERADDFAHLRDDAAFAEDLAIRYADVRRGRRSGHFESVADYGRTRDACMAALFAVIADGHGVRPAQVRRALMRRPATFDAGVVASFFVLYGWVVYGVARWLVARFNLRRLSAAVAVTLVASGPIAVAGLVSGGLWSGMFEMIRIGNAHMSYRAFRVPWGQHSLALFLACAGMFWIAMLVGYRARRGGNDLQALIAS